MLLASKVGMNFAIGCPEGYEPNKNILKQAKKFAKETGTSVEVFHDPVDAVKDADKLKDGFKIGLEYEYQFIEWLGVRGFADYEAGKLDKWLFGAGASFHVPKTGLGLFVGGGVETRRGHTDEFFRLSSFERSQKAYCLLLEELARRKF